MSQSKNMRIKARRNKRKSDNKFIQNQKEYKQGEVVKRKNLTDALLTPKKIKKNNQNLVDKFKRLLKLKT